MAGIFGKFWPVGERGNGVGSGIQGIFGNSARTVARRSDDTRALPEHRRRRRGHRIRDRSAHPGHRARSNREVGPVPVGRRLRAWGYRALVAWRLSPTGATDSLLLDPMAGAAGSVVRIRKCVLFLGFAALAACSEAAPEAPMPADAAERIKSALLPTFVIRGEPTPHRSLADRMDELGVPGVSVAVLADGEIGWARGYGFADVESRRPVTANTLFQAASVSKPVAALAALQLVEEGRVDLDADVNTYQPVAKVGLVQILGLKAWQTPFKRSQSREIGPFGLSNWPIRPVKTGALALCGEPSTFATGSYLRSWLLPSNELTTEAPVTLRGLLTHRAGLSVSGFPGYGPDEPVPDAPGVLDGRGNTDPVRVVITPGERWQYSGGGYTVMQQFVADLRGEPFAVVMRRHVLDPIGMVRSTYEQPIPDDRQDDIAKGYRPDGSPVIGGWHTYPEQAAAGLWTTPSELALYAREVQRAWRGESARVLGGTLAREMLTPDEDSWGLGPSISEDGERFRHGGSNQGFRSTLIAHIDGDDGVFVLTNSDSGSELANEIAITVADAYGWSGPRPRELVPVDLAADVRERYGGTYMVAERGIAFEVALEGRGLALSWQGGKAVQRALNDMWRMGGR